MAKDNKETPVEKIQEDIKKEHEQENDLIEVEEMDEQVPADDADMPEPATREIQAFLKLSDKFFEYLTNTVGRLSYNYILEGPGVGRIKLTDLVKFLETNRDKLTANEVNTACSFIACAPYNLVRPLMEVIESPEKQGELWMIYEV